MMNSITSFSITLSSALECYNCPTPVFDPSECNFTATCAKDQVSYDIAYEQVNEK